MLYRQYKARVTDHTMPYKLAQPVTLSIAVIMGPYIAKSSREDIIPQVDVHPTLVTSALRSALSLELTGENKLYSESGLSTAKLKQEGSRLR